MGCLGTSASLGERQNASGGGYTASNGPKLLVIVGPSGSNQADIMKTEERKRKGQFVKAVSHTTRSMQEGEKDGVDYYFISSEEFDKMESNGEFIETSENNGAKYGLSKKELEKKQQQNKIAYVNVDVTGANLIKKLNIPANYVSILPSTEKAITDNIKTKYDNLTKTLQDKSDKAKQSTEEAKQKLQDQVKQNSEEMQKKIDKAKEDMNTIKSSTLFNLQVIGDDIKKAATDFDSQLKACYPEQLNN